MEVTQEASVTCRDGVRDGYRVIQPQKTELDTNESADRFAQAVINLLRNNGHLNYCVDLSELASIRAKGLDCLLKIENATERFTAAHRLSVIAPNPGIYQTLQVTKLEELFRVYRTEEDFKNSGIGSRVQKTLS